MERCHVYKNPAVAEQAQGLPETSHGSHFLRLGCWGKMADGNCPRGPGAAPSH